MAMIRSFFICCSAALIVGAVSFTGADGQLSAQEAGEETPPQRQDDLTLDELNDDSIVDGADTNLGSRLSRIERDIGEALRAQASNDSEAADRAFNSAYSLIQAISTDYLADGVSEPLVRAVNQAKPGDVVPPEFEVWRPFSQYLIRWMSLFPSKWMNRIEADQGGRAREELRRARVGDDEAGIRRVAALYFYTQAGQEALNSLCAILLERGDFTELASWRHLQREVDPSSFQRHGAAWLQLILALQARGDRDLLAYEESLLTPEAAAASVRMGGRDLTLSEARQELNRMMDFSAAGRSDDQSLSFNQLGAPLETRTLPANIATTQGYGSRFEVMPVFYRGGVILPYNLPNAEETRSGRTYYSSSRNNEPTDERMKRDHHLTWFPKIGSRQRRQLTIPDAALYSYPVSSRNYYYYYGAVQSQVFRTYGAQVATLPQPDGTTRDYLLSLFTTAGGKSLAFTGSQIQGFDLHNDGELAFTIPSEADLSVVNRVTLAHREEQAKGASRGRWGEIQPPGAKLLDALSAEDRANYDQGYALSRMHFCGQPLIDQNRLYVIGALSQANSCEYHVLCFDLALAEGSGQRGQLLWMRKFVSRAEMSFGWGGSTNASIVEASTLSLVGDRLIAVSNVGAVASMSARNGDVDWVVKYAIEDDLSAGSMFNFRQTPYRSTLLVPSAPVVTGATVVCSPVDALSGFSLNLLNGLPVRRLMDSNRSYDVARFHLGVAGGMAYYQLSDRFEAEPVLYDSMVEQPDGSTKPTPALSFREANESLLAAGAAQLVAGLPNSRLLNFQADVKAAIAGDYLLAPSPWGLRRFDRHTLRLIDCLPWPDKPDEVLRAEIQAATGGSRSHPDGADKPLHWSSQGQAGVTNVHVGTLGGSGPRHLIITSIHGMWAYPLVD